MKASLSKAKTGPFLIMLAALCWSTCGVLVKSSQWSGLSIAVLRGILTMLVYLVVLGHVRIKLTKMKVGIAICFFLQSVLFMCANKFTTAGSVTALQNTSPIYIILLNALLLKYKPRALDILTCVLLLLGIFFTVAGGSAKTNFLGNCLALASGVFYAAVFFFSSVSKMDTLESLVLGNAMYLFLLPVLFRDPAVLSGGIQGWFYPILCALLCGCLAWLFFRAGIKSCSPLQANFVAMLEPVVSPLWTLIFLGEKMPPLSVAGCVLVIATLLIYNAKTRKEAAGQGAAS